MLTPRETQVAQLIAKEKRNKEIADQLGISTETVKEHVHNITRKLNVKSRVGVAVWCASNHEGCDDPTKEC